MTGPRPLASDLDPTLPGPGSVELGASLRRAGQALDRAGRALLAAELDAAGAADLAGDAVRSLVRELARAGGSR